MSTPLRRYYRGTTLYAIQDVQGGTTSYPHLDHQGTVQCLTSSAGVVTDRFASDAWGVQVKRTGSSINRQWYVGNWGYYRQKDWQSDYVRNRYFRPVTGRWQAEDPISQWCSVQIGTLTRPASSTICAQGVGFPYAYVVSVPTRFVDPSGLVTRATCPTQPGSYGDREECLKALAKLADAIRKFREELDKYDPVKDVPGNFETRRPHPWYPKPERVHIFKKYPEGFVGPPQLRKPAKFFPRGWIKKFGSPGGHVTEMGDQVNRMRSAIPDIIRHCRKDDHGGPRPGQRLIVEGRQLMHEYEKLKERAEAYRRQRALQPRRAFQPQPAHHQWAFDPNITQDQWDQWINALLWLGGVVAIGALIYVTVVDPTLGPITIPVIIKGGKALAGQGG